MRDDEVAAQGSEDRCRTIRLTDRSTQPISKELYSMLGNSPEFQKMIDIGAVSLVRSKKNPYAVRASSYVGTAVLEKGYRLIIAEKFPGTLRALLNWVVPRDLRLADLPAQYASGMDFLRLLAERFLDCLGSYLSRGRLKEYRANLEQSFMPAGRIDVQRTAMLAATGKVAQIAYWRSELSADLELNRLLAFSLFCISRWTWSDTGLPAIVARARRIAALFEDVRWLHLAALPSGDLSDVFENVLLDTRINGELRDAVLLARVLMLYLGGVPEDFRASAPHSVLINLEPLFEEATRRALAGVLPQCTVREGEALKKRLFDGEAGTYEVNPDIVAGATGRIFVVADCKFKSLKGSPQHDDVYQVFAHATALECRQALIIYPGDDLRITDHGVSHSGVRLCSALVRPTLLGEDLAQTMAALGRQP